MTTNTTMETWLQRFDKEIGTVAIMEGDEKMSIGTHIVKGFIHSEISRAIQEERDRIVKEVEGITFGHENSAWILRKQRVIDLIRNKK